MNVILLFKEAENIVAKGEIARFEKSRLLHMRQKALISEKKKG